MLKKNEEATNSVAQETVSSEVNGVNDQNSTVINPKKDSPTSKTSKETSDAGKKTEKDYLPVYSKEEEERLAFVKSIVEEEMDKILNDKAYSATPFSNGANAILDLNTAVANGIILLTPEVNRTHGKDEFTTGESLMRHGAQHPLIVISRPMAEAAGIKVVRFSNDPDKDKPVPDDAKALVVIDGNGRINYLYDIEPNLWPEITAVFPRKNRAGYYDIPTCINCINTDVSKWKTQDFVQKLILEEGADTHEGWKMINQLVRQGYGYQSACQLATLETDRIQKNKVCAGDTKTIFLHFESASKVFEVLSERFSKDLTPIKTKEFTKEVSAQWKLLQKNYGDSEATVHYVNFLKETLTDIFVKSIQEAKVVKGTKGKISKDEVRKNTLQKAFYQYVGKHDLKID